MSLKVALCQMEVREDPRENLKVVEEFLKRSSVELLVFPELAITGYLALECPSYCLDELRRLAGLYERTLLVGLPFEGRNCALLVDEGVRVISEKSVLFPGLDDEAGFVPGRKKEVVEVGGLGVGVLVCFELRFPELARVLTREGAGLILVISQWPKERVWHMWALARARAVENQVFVGVANACGRFKGGELGGTSVAFGPSGEPLVVGSSTREELLEFEVDPEALGVSRRLFNSSSALPTDAFTSKVVELEKLISVVRRRRALGHRMVFTNGCFDILHAGHVSYLKEARALGDFLVVGLNSDASVRRIKGGNRPVIPQDQRAQVLSSLWCVDYVVVFDEDTPERLIRELKPDVLVKGEDWPEDKIVGAEFVKSYGGIVKRIPFSYDISTTRIIERIRCLE